MARVGIQWMPSPSGLRSRLFCGTDQNSGNPLAAIVRVRVRLEPEHPGQPIVAANLEVLVKHALRQRGGNRDEVEGFIRFGDGVSLADGRREVEVVLPTILTKLRVRSNTGEVLGGLSWSDEDPLGELEFTPESGNTETVVLKVRAPTRTGKKK